MLLRNSVGSHRARRDWARLLVGALVVVSGCSERVHFLGYNAEAVTSEAPVPAVDAGRDAAVDTSSASEPTADVDAAVTGSSASGSLVSGDGGETNAGDGGTNLGKPRNPPNVLVDDLGLDPATVQKRLTNLFERLFVSGNADSELIYYELNDEQAYVLDVLHDDARMDAMGYGLMLTLQFDKPEQFARLWTTVETYFRYATGPRAGYFHFSCAKDFTECSDAIDSFGSFYAVTALLLASERWGETRYFDAAVETLAAMRNKEVNGVATEGVVNLFTDDGIPRQVPLEEEANTVSPVSLLPAFFEYWSLRTGDAFWHTVAETSRRMLTTVANSDTGLTPDVLSLAGEPSEMPPMFREESYPAAFQLALDAAWFNHQSGTPEAYVTQVNRLLGFFNRQGNYVASYETDGTAVTTNTSTALVTVNGAAASIATLPSRDTFLQRAWETTGPSGVYRFYDGVYQLLGLMFLGGEFKVVFEP